MHAPAYHGDDHREDQRHQEEQHVRELEHEEEVSVVDTSLLFELRNILHDDGAEGDGAEQRELVDHLSGEPIRQARRWGGAPRERLKAESAREKRKSVGRRRQQCAVTLPKSASPSPVPTLWRICSMITSSRSVASTSPIIISAKLDQSQ